MRFASSPSRRCTASRRQRATTRQWFASSPTAVSAWEVLPLRPEDFDGETLQVRRTAHEGQILEGTETDHGEPDAGRIVPVPVTLAWMLQAQLQVSGNSDLLFTTPTGRMWRERNFYRDLWRPAQRASGLDIRPHECRHSYVTNLRRWRDIE